MKFDLKDERHFFFIAVLAMLSYLTYELIIWAEHHFLSYDVQGLMHMFHAFTIPLIFFGYLHFFNTWAWRWRLWRILKIIDHPDLNGVYKGEFISSYKDGKGNAVKGDMILTIKQTAGEVVVNGKFNQSESVSIQSFFAHNDFKGQSCLYYFYKNKPVQGAVDSMHAHEGSAVLCFDSKEKTLSGEYYSGRDRNNYGDIFVKKVS